MVDMPKTAWIVLGIIILGFAYWTVSPFFIVKEVHDEMPAAVEVQAESVPVVDTSLHPAHGTVRIIEADGKTYIRYENYQTLNGPDLFVYLAKDTEAKEFVSLGKIRGTMGEIQYEVPENIRIADYPYVLTWCRAFGVLFNYADLRPLLGDDGDSGMICVQVITPARNPQTGEIKEFPTPCDVPSGWEVIQNDIPTL